MCYTQWDGLYLSASLALILANSGQKIFGKILPKPDEAGKLGVLLFPAASGFCKDFWKDFFVQNLPESRPKKHSELSRPITCSTCYNTESEFRYG